MSVIYRQTTDRRQTTDGRVIAYSERKREFTFANNTSSFAALVYLLTLDHVSSRHSNAAC